MSDRRLEAIRDLIQDDPGGRGLRADPEANLVNAFPNDFADACRSLAKTTNLAVGIVTGFLIPHVRPHRAETDGPPGALFLARALTGLGAKVVLATDDFCEGALGAGLVACRLDHTVPVITLPTADAPECSSAETYWRKFTAAAGRLTHLIALERVGPSHTPDSIQAQPGTTAETVQRFTAEIPAEQHDRWYTMRGRDMTGRMSPAHWLFEVARTKPTPLQTIGVGDGGNEIGMGKIPWEVIRRNVPLGGLVACRVPTDCLVVAGVSNWGAYGLAAGLLALRGSSPDPELFDANREAVLLQLMIQRGPLVDGVTGEASLSVDGLDFDRYAAPLRRLKELFT
jgi:hypothetical protein